MFIKIIKVDVTIDSFNDFPWNLHSPIYDKLGSLEEKVMSGLWTARAMLSFYSLGRKRLLQKACSSFDHESESELVRSGKKRFSREI